MTGGTISGSGGAGYTVALGNLVPGKSGSFTVSYSLAYTKWPPNYLGPERAVNAPSMWPDGSQIVAKVTGTNTNAANVGPSTANSPPLTWNNFAGAPTVRHYPPRLGGDSTRAVANGGTLVTDQTDSYPVIMSTGCWSYATSGSFWWVSSTNRLCAASTRSRRTARRRA